MLAKGVWVLVISTWSTWTLAVFAAESAVQTQASQTDVNTDLSGDEVCTLQVTSRKTTGCTGALTVPPTQCFFGTDGQTTASAFFHTAGTLSLKVLHGTQSSEVIDAPFTQRNQTLTVTGLDPMVTAVRHCSDQKAIQLSFAGTASDLQLQAAECPGEVHSLREQPEQQQTFGAAATSQGSQDLMVVKLDLLTDNFPGETAWELAEACVAGRVVVASQTCSTLNCGKKARISWTVSVPPGPSYVFRMKDTFGDGICCSYGLGNYALTVDEVIVANSSGKYKKEEDTAIGCQGFNCPAGLLLKLPVPRNVIRSADTCCTAPCSGYTCSQSGQLAAEVSQLILGSDVNCMCSDPCSTFNCPANVVKANDSVDVVGAYAACCACYQLTVDFKKCTVVWSTSADVEKWFSKKMKEADCKSNFEPRFEHHGKERIATLSFTSEADAILAQWCLSGVDKKFEVTRTNACLS